MRLLTFLLLLPLLLIAGCSDNQNDWQQLAKADLDFIKKTIENDHPGYFDTDNPEFRTQLNQSYKVAIDQLKYVESADALFNLEHEFIASFADVHFTLQPRFQSLNQTWAGMRIERRNGQYIVAKKATDWPINLPKIGAVLISCDGVDIEKIMDSDVLRFRYANYTDEYPRYKYASKLLIDDRVGFRTRFEACVFAHDQAEQHYQLVWKGYQHLDSDWDASIPLPDDFYVKEFYYTNWWVRISSFDFVESSSSKLSILIDDLNRTTLDDDDTVVFDVRGNGGGYSDHGIEFLKAIYGKENFAALLSQAYNDKQTQAMWRASEGNIAAAKDKLANVSDVNTSIKKYYELMIEKMERAYRNGENYAVQPMNGVVGGPVEIQNDLDEIIKKAPEILVLTDYFCASACLDFVALVKLMPKARHIGLTTSADTRYNESRLLELPSKLGFIQIPQKILAPRGPFQPDEKFAGDINSVDQLKNWIRRISKNNFYSMN